MTNIALHIEYLLTKHDCVILPGWGAFIAQHSKAFSFEDSCRFKRPSKHITFNQSLDHNDGMLAHSIIRRDGVTYEVANKLIGDYVASLKKQIEVDGVVALGKIGCFRSGTETKLFEPYNNANTCDYNFGLTDLNIPTLSQLMHEVATQDDGASESRGVIASGFGRKFIQIAASIAVLLCMTFMLSTPLNYDSNADYAALNSSIRVKSSSPRVPLNEYGCLSIALPNAETSQLVNEEKSEIKPSASEVKAEAAKPTQKDVAQESNTLVEIPHNANGVYYLIVSSLDTRAQAEKFVAQHKDDLRILESDGRYRIYAAQSNSHKAIKAASKQLESRYPGCWILR